jgi:rubrerythrin
MLTSEENITYEQGKAILSYFCPLCNSELNEQPKTCPNCSAPLLWD